jgi:hypothetical protein
VPSGYKEDKIYSVVPTDGSGDLDFTRASNATRVNSAGLIEKVRTNLFLYSEEFDNASWTKLGSTISSNSITSPSGTLTADKVIEDISNGVHRVSQTPTTAIGTYVFSVYAKAGERNLLQLRDGSSAVGVWFDLSNGTVLTQNAGISGLIQSVGNGWYRCIAIRTTIVTNIVFAFSISITDGSQVYTGDGTSGLYVWGAQLELGDIATDYIPTTTAAVSVGMTADVPRLDYLGSSCPSLLLEPQRTNLVQYSEQFDNAYWTKFNTTITANNAVAPDGTSSADRLVLTSVSPAAQTLSRQTAIVSSTTTITFSTFVKYVDKQYIQLVFSSGFSSQFANFDLINGTVTAGTYVGANVQSYANGWYRISITTTGLNTNVLPFIWSIDTPLAARAVDSTSTGTSSYLIWGAQIEDGSYATSYIPTLATSVTRVADAASKTGISSLIGQTEGVLFIDMEFNGYDSETKWIAFLVASASDYIGIYTNSGSLFTAEVSNGAAQFLSVSFAFVVGQRYKLALAYKANDFAFYVNGTQVATDNSGTVPATSQFSFEYNSTNVRLAARKYNQALLFKTRLSNTELAQITTL